MSFGEDVRNFLNKHLNAKSTLFHKYQSEQLERHRAFFDTVEKNPLTQAQRRVTILNERRNLVVAGAGSGKTSVIVAKVGYLVESGICKASDILLLTYARDAACELSQRCKERLGLEIKATTFHALGNRILGAVEDEQPSLTKLAQDKAALNRFLEAVLEELLTNKKKWHKLKAFILPYLKLCKEEAAFDTLEAYAAHVRSGDLRALSGDWVKSLAELNIANFFFFNGIEFEYERRYPDIPELYQPDFYLPQYDIWLEHFGINREGGTAPFIDENAYKSAMAWKRTLHNARGTKLIETYSYQQSEGTLLRDLKKALLGHGVQFRDRSEKEIKRALKKAGYVSLLSKLVGDFLTHFKSGDGQISKLRAQAHSSEDRHRALTFLDLFALFFHRYEEELTNSDPKQIDFNDMIARATQYVRSGVYEVPWTYIIVDEFQDISQGRYRLLEAMLRQKKALRFFAVGDDWQSIYRFAGSDISIMSRFRKFFGKATILKLDTTFRFNDRIAAVSSDFIQRNPAQIKKTLSTRTKAMKPQVFLHWSDMDPNSGRFDRTMLEKTVEIAGLDQDLQDVTLQVLARYKKQLPKYAAINTISKIWPGIVLKPLTIHGAKGLEADFVIVNALSSSGYGFPSKIEDDPLLSLVLAVPDTYAHAEERRLFYVALTRARKQVHLVVDRKHPSVFAMELINGGYEVVEVGSRCNGAVDVCDKCGVGTMLQKEGPYGPFFGCSNWPACTNRYK